MNNTPVWSAEDIAGFVAQSMDTLALAGQRVLVIVPDSTRTMPLPAYFRALCATLLPRVRQLDFLIALGTHPPMSEAAILAMFGLSAEERAGAYRDVRIFNHAWKDPAALVTLGEIPADDIAALSNGLFRQGVPVRLNKLVLDYDHLLICGPVFPHEVAGFSGGNKYFFPGIAGADIIDFTHWLGALITSYDIIGTKNTPVRAVIDRAAAMIPTPRHALCSVVTHDGLIGAFFGSPESAFAQAADVSAQTHVKYMPRPYKTVLAVLPTMYDEMWLGGKGMYKTEPVCADDGEVIIYAPHLHEISVTHGALIRQVGYHVRDYFVKQWDKFKHVPWGVLAHSTHVRGIGSYDAETGIERPRVKVTLATGIPEAECRAINLGYRDPASIDPDAWIARADPDVLVVPRAGEYLYRLARP
ncbi:MAG: DUF2088 domain-containing protein [Thermoflexales bacterium]|nr:DUF2088 domain-containing protein [Thermoflexales bacterium]